MQIPAARTMAFLVVLLVAAVVRPARAEVLFVDGACAAGGSGRTLACGATGPFRTIGEGIEAMAPGDTLNVRGAHDGFDGVYFEQLVLAPDSPLAGKPLSCTASARCVIQGCRAPACPADERPIVRGMTRRSDWTQRNGVFTRRMEASPVPVGQERDDFDPDMVMQGGTSAPFTMLAYAGDGVAAPPDGRWSYDPVARTIAVNPVGGADAAAAVYVPHFAYNVQIEDPTAYVTLQHLAFEGTRSRGIDARGPRPEVPGLVLRDLVQRYVPRYFVLANGAPGLVIEDSVAEYGCRGISWAAPTGDGCFAYRVFGADGVVMRRNVVRHLGSAGERNLANPDSDGRECQWCDPPWNDRTHTDVSATGLCYQVKQTSGGLVEDNVCEDVRGGGVSLDVSRAVTVQRNAIRRTTYGLGMINYTPTMGCPSTDPREHCFNQDHVLRGNRLDVVGGRTLCAVMIHADDRRHDGGTFLARLYNNFVSRPAFGAICVLAEDGRTIADLAIWNNSIWGVHPFLGDDSPPDGLVVRDRARNLEVRNNVFSGLTGDGIVLVETALPGTSLDGDLVHALGGCAVRWDVPPFGTLPVGGVCDSITRFALLNPGQEPNATVGDPRFVDPAATWPDLHLSAGSAAIDAGVPLGSQVTSDADGEPRPLGVTWDAGADESQTCGDGIVQAPEQCDDTNLADGDGCDSNCTRTGCGNGIRTTGEQCDDGNRVVGDCCDGSCRFEPAGAACDDGQPCTSSDGCMAGVCAGIEAPAAGCRAGGAGTLLVRDGDGDASRDLLRWRWRNGPPTSLADFGDPVAGATAYTVCLYDAGADGERLFWTTTLAPRDTCGDGAACWTWVRGGGVRYRNRPRGEPSSLELVLKADDRGRAKLKLKGKGDFLPRGGLPLAQDPRVTMQLVNDRACWETVHLAPAKRSDESLFSDGGQ